MENKYLAIRPRIEKLATEAVKRAGGMASPDINPKKFADILDQLKAIHPDHLVAFREELSQNQRLQKVGKDQASRQEHLKSSFLILLINHAIPNAADVSRTIEDVNRQIHIERDKEKSPKSGGSLPLRMVKDTAGRPPTNKPVIDAILAKYGLAHLIGCDIYRISSPKLVEERGAIIHGLELSPYASKTHFSYKITPKKFKETVIPYLHVLKEKGKKRN